MGRSLWIGLWVAGIVLLAGVARADDVADARNHAKHAIAAYGLHDYVTAANEYEAAFKLEPDPALLYNAAQAHRLGGNSTRALELYQSYLRLFGARIANAAEVERHIAELKRALAAQQQAANAPPMAPTPSEASTPATVESAVVVPPADVSAPSTPPADRPLWKRGWLWGVVAGVVVVGVAVGVGVGLGAQPKDPKPSMGALSF